MSEGFTHPVRVYWEDTDAGGIVFYANYLKFMERARTEWLRSLGIEQQALKLRTGGMFVVTDTRVKYLQPARLDDVLHVSCQIVGRGRASIQILQKISLCPANAMNSLLLNQEHASASVNAGKTGADGAAQSAKPHAHGMAQTVCEGTICIAWVNSVSLKPGRIPQDILEVLT